MFQLDFVYFDRDRYRSIPPSIYFHDSLLLINQRPRRRSERCTASECSDVICTRAAART